MPKANTYQSVEEVLLSLPAGERKIVQQLRAIVLACLPKAKEKLSYGVPFYSRNRMICFIWPPTITWDPQQLKKKEANIAKGVTLGFCQGNRMSNEDGALLAEGRKQVYCMYFKTLKEIDEPQIRALLFEAELVDESFKKKRK
ncbi:MAG TPA: DUF1801 domain-containing protein [Cytophagales bacterium]|nr:DUF1801 domain-containing protein [Cytophagales bacterium]HRG06998.1 DUF1801 domain-containing protein [Cyclobacteriaceae bacterium]